MNQQNYNNQNYNNQNYNGANSGNPYNGQNFMNNPYPNGMPYGGPMQNKPQKGKFGLGVLVGVFSGILAFCMVFVFVCSAANLQIVFTNRGVGGSVATFSDSPILDEETVEKINELATYANLYYYDEIDSENLKDGLYYGLVEGLGDKYSVYYNPDDFAELQLSTTGQYYGIGAGLSQDMDTMVVTITKVYEGTPSESAGLKTDDVIVSVDGIDATSMEVSELVKHIRGEKGTTVHLEIYRASTGEYLSVDVERADITLPSVSSEMLENGIGYILIDSFETDTAHQFKEAVSNLESQGMQALILDVRYNPGGMIDSVVEILDEILPEGMLVYTEDKYGNRQEYTSKGESYMNYPMAVLINESSASASEILAGAIKDYEYGTLIGTTTYGKGIVQTIFPLDDGDAIKITTAKYFTPNGNYIHGEGISPDIELEYEYLNPEGESYEKQYDNQILKAIEVLKDEIGVE